MAKSYYAVLGINPDASADEIRSSYRRLAKRYHPDHFEGGSKAFRKIKEAYAVLGDAKRRKEYEQSIENKIKPRHRRTAPSTDAEPLIPENRPEGFTKTSRVKTSRSFFSPNDTLWEWLWDPVPDMDSSWTEPERNFKFDVLLTREEAYRGGRIRLMVPIQAFCPECLGRGGVGPYLCHRCSGRGIIEGEVPVFVEHPPGMQRDYAVSVRLANEGIPDTTVTVVFRPTNAAVL